jgi:hypothetical protein
MGRETPRQGALAGSSRAIDGNNGDVIAQR